MNLDFILQAGENHPRFLNREMIILGFFLKLHRIAKHRGLTLKEI